MPRPIDNRIAALEYHTRPLARLTGAALRAWVDREAERMKQDHTVATMIEAGRLTADGGHIFATDPADLDACIIAEIVRLTDVKPTVIYAEYDPAPDAPTGP